MSGIRFTHRHDPQLIKTAPEVFGEVLAYPYAAKGKGEQENKGTT